MLDFEVDKEVIIILGRKDSNCCTKMRTDYAGQQVTFNVLHAMKSPDDIKDCNFISVVDFAVVERLNSCCSNEEIKAITFKELKDKDLEKTNMV